MSEPFIRFTREGVEISGEAQIGAMALFVVALIAALLSKLVYGEVRTAVVVPALIGGLIGVALGRWWSGRKDAPR